MFSFTDFYNKLKRQYINVSMYGAASLMQYVLHLPLFGYFFLFGKGRAPFPFNITMDLTYDCNLRCKFCFFYAPGKLLNFKNEPHLNLNEIKKLVDSVKGRNTSFTLSGGEPALRKDIIEIIESIKENKFICGLLTNGVALEPAISNRLIDLDLDYVCVSLNGPRDVDDELRGRNTFDRSYDNIRSIIAKRKKNKPKILINLIICSANYTRLREVIDIAADLKIDCLSLSMLCFLGKEEFEAHRDFLKINFPYEKFEDLIYTFDAKSAEVKDLPFAVKQALNYAKRKKVNIFLKPGMNNDELGAWFNPEFFFARRCIFIWNVAKISPYGDVYPCYPFPIKMGNVRSATVEEIWNSEKFCNFRKLIREKKVLAGCNRCLKL